MLASELTLELARNLNRTSAEVSAQAVPLMNAWINDWATRWPYADYLEASATFNTTANTKTYSLSANVDKIYDFVIPAYNVHLERITEEQYKLATPSAYYGTPYFFAPFNERQVNLLPIPEGVVAVNYFYYKTPTAINTTDALSAQTPAISEKYHNAGVWYCTWRMAQRMGDVDLVALAKNEYDITFEMAKQDMLNRVAGSNRVRVASDMIGGGSIITDKASDMMWGES